jgi:hypothetical protein
VIDRKMDYKNDVVWVDMESKTKYGNVIGAIGWPGKKDGFVVVGAVDAMEDHDLEGYRIFILAEQAAGDVDMLLRLALKMKDEFSLDKIFADTANASMMELLRAFNKDRTEGGLKTLHLSAVPPQGEGSLAFHFQLIKKLTRPGKKLLHFAPESIFPGYLMSISPQVANTATAADHPGIAALGLVVDRLSRYRPEREKRRPTHSKTDWDPWGNRDGG